MGNVLSWAVGVGGFVLGALAVSGMVVVDWAAWVLVLPSRRPGAIESQVTFETDPASPARRLGHSIEAVAADGVRLAGIWHAAEKTGQNGRERERVLLLIHGFAEGPSALQTRMEALNRHGWDVAALDTRAHGRSGGDRGSFGGREGADIASWIDAVTVLTKGAPVVAVWGRSMGAAIAARASADDPRIAALVLEAPYLDLEVTLAEVLRRRRIPLSRFLARLILRRAQALAGASLDRPRPIDLASRINAPALVIHGADDALIPAADARRLASAFPRPAPFLEIPGAGHNSVVDIGGPELLERIASFLDDAVDARTPHPSGDRSQNPSLRPSSP